MTVRILESICVNVPLRRKFILFFCYRIPHRGLKYSSMLKKVKLNTANIQFSRSTNTIFSSAITENRFQMSLRFHSSRSDCDVILTGNVVCPGLWFSWIIADSFAESNSPITFRRLDAEDGSCNDFFPILLQQSLAGVCV